MGNIAPPLTTEGFHRGCSQSGATRPMTQSVNVGNADITFTTGGIIITTNDPLLLKQLSDAKTAVGDRTARVSLG